MERRSKRQKIMSTISCVPLMSTTQMWISRVLVNNLNLLKLIMERVNVKMTNDTSSNSFMLHQMSTTELFQSAIDGLHDITMSEQSEQFTGSDSSQVPSMPNFVVGLNNIVSDVKNILFKKGVSIVGVEGMGGSGKTTISLAPRNDPEVKGKNKSPVLIVTPSFHFIASLLFFSVLILIVIIIFLPKQYSFHSCCTVSKCNGPFGDYVR